MSNGIEQFGIGKNFTVYAKSVIPNSSTGVFSDTGSSMTFNGRLVNHSAGLQLETDNISPSDCPNTNGVVIEQATRFTIQELNPLYVLGNANAPRLETLVLASFYMRLIIDKYDNSNAARSGSSGLLRRMIAYVRFINWNEDVPKEKVIMAADVETIAVADGAGGWKTNPFFTSDNAVTDIP